MPTAGDDRTDPRVDLLGELFDKEVWAVDGELIRDEIDVDYVEGGNGARYSYVPDEEIWIEQDLDATDAAPTIVHEIVEFYVMTCSGKSYDAAHDAANPYEIRMRKAIEDGAIIVDDPVEAARSFLDGELSD